MAKHVKPSFWKRIRTKYKVSSLNESSLEEVFTLRVSKFTAIIAVLGAAFVLVLITSIIILATPIRNFLPDYLDAEIREKMVENALKADSIEQILARQSGYLNNISAIIRGDEIIDTIPRIDSLASTSELNLGRSAETDAFIKEYEETEKFNLNSFMSSIAIPNNLIFYSPARGIISDRFNLQEGHYGIDIATSPKESILATMKGIVIFAGFDANGGYVIQLQHPNGFVSIYKHNALLLKKQGDEVIAGEAIALAGNTGRQSTGAHLHFELWYQGYPINPEEFIVF